MDKELVIKNNLSHGYINGKVVPFTYEVIKENNNELIFPDFSFDIQLIFSLFHLKALKEIVMPKPLIQKFKRFVG